MTVDYLGSLTLEAAIPGAAAAALAGEAGIGLALPDIQARLEALASFAPTPVDFSASIALAQSIIANIQAAAALGITPPSLDAQIAIVAGIVADLQAAVVSINAQLTIVVDFLNLLTAAGVHGYVYSGTVGNLGGELSVELAGGVPGGAGAGEACNALVLVTTSSGTWATMGQVFKTTP